MIHLEFYLFLHADKLPFIEFFYLKLYQNEKNHTRKQNYAKTHPYCKGIQTE